MPAHRYAALGKIQGLPVAIRTTVGYYGYFAGPDTYVIDRCGLGDPLLARLPLDTTQEWRIGHNLREIPEGYLHTVAYGKNLIEDQDLAEYYDHLTLVISGDLFDWERLVTIFKLNCGTYDDLLHRNESN